MLVLLFGIAGNAQVLKIGVVGLTHDHAYGLMNQYKNGEVDVIGIVETDKVLIDRYKKRYQLADGLFFTAALPKCCRV